MHWFTLSSKKSNQVSSYKTRRIRNEDALAILSSLPSDNNSISSMNLCLTLGFQETLTKDKRLKTPSQVFLFSEQDDDLLILQSSNTRRFLVRLRDFDNKGSPLLLPRKAVQLKIDREGRRESVNGATYIRWCGL